MTPDQEDDIRCSVEDEKSIDAILARALLEAWGVERAECLDLLAKSEAWGIQMDYLEAELEIALAATANMRAVHEAEMGVCERHCEVVAAMRAEVTAVREELWLAVPVLRAGGADELDTFASRIEAALDRLKEE